MKFIYVLLFSIVFAGCAFNSNLGEKFKSLSPPKQGMAKMYIYNVKSGSVPAFIQLNGVEYKVSEYAFIELDVVPTQYEIKLIRVWANVKTGVSDQMELTAKDGETHFMRINQIRDPKVVTIGERMYTTEITEVGEAQALSELVSKGKESKEN